MRSVQTSAQRMSFSLVMLLALLGAAMTAFAAPQAGAARSEDTLSQLPPSHASAAMARLQDRNGRLVGIATLIETERGVRVEVEARGLRPGEHGLHIYATAHCYPPDVPAAGVHFNPGLRQHGLANPLGPHAGDLPALDVNPDGTAAYQALNPLVTLRLGHPVSLFDGDGSSLVIHAEADDQRTDPDGRSGAHVACGTIIVP